MSKPAVMSSSRVFLIEGGAGPTHQPTYMSCMKTAGISRSFGDITKIECPHPTRYGQFVTVGNIRAASERATTSLMGHYARDLKSVMLRLARNGCPFDVQVHFGMCKDASSFDQYDKAVILENVYLTNYSTEDLGALESGEEAKIDETGDISAEDVYEIVPLMYTSRDPSVVTNELIDVIIADEVSCGGECDTASDGDNKIYALSLAAGGSASTAADIVFSVDGGTTWYAHDVDTLGAAEAPSGLAKLGDYLVVVASGSNSLHYATKTEFAATGDPSFSEITTGFVATKTPNDIFSTGTRAWIVANGGYIYLLTNAPDGVTVQLAGTAGTDNLNAVHAVSDTFAVAAGNSGFIVYTTDGGVSWSAITPPVGAGVHFNCVWCKSEKEWWLGTSTGRLYYTLDGGTTFTEKAFSGSGAGAVHDIVFPTKTVGYMSHASATPRGRIFQTRNGGYTWVLQPDSGTMPAGDRFTALAASVYDADFVVGVGLADNGTDGFVVTSAPKAA